EALLTTAVERLVVAGGVAANQRLRSRMTEAADALGVEVLFPRPALCTDNAAMIALAGLPRLLGGTDDGLALAADADLPFGVAWPGWWAGGARRTRRSPPRGSGRANAGGSTSSVIRRWHGGSSTRRRSGPSRWSSRSAPVSVRSPTSSPRARHGCTWSRSTA